MSPRSVLSPEERDLVLREVHQEAGSTRIPIRTGKTSGGGERPPATKDGSPTGNASGPPPRNAGGGRGRHGPGGALPPPDTLRLPRRTHRARRVVLLVILVVLILIGLSAAKLLSVGGAVLSPERSVVAQLADLLFRRGAVRGEAENRVNILLLAVGGEGHQGENLADTVIFASFRPKEQDVALLSVPRDLYVKVPGTELYARLNAVHAYGESQKRGEGLKLLRQKVEEVTGQPVHYVVRVDFIAFKRIVDEIGGIDITIPNTFYDYWHRINFPAGTEHMNGDRALAYVRARFVEGPEGGDFKRAARTQQVLLAIRKRLLSAQTAVDLRALTGVLDALKDNVATNFTLGELKRLADLTHGIGDGNIHSAVLTTGAEGLLVGRTEILGGRPASVLQPRAGLDAYDEIKAFATDIFAQARVAPTPTAGEAVPPTPPAGPPGTFPTPPAGPVDVASEQPTVEVRNGTAVTGLAARAAKAFEKQGFTIGAIGNAALRNRTQTVIVDRTNGKKPASLKALLDTLGVGTAVQFPEGEKETVDANFVVFLGADVAEKFKR